MPYDTYPFIVSYHAHKIKHKHSQKWVILKSIRYGLRNHLSMYLAICILY